MAKPIPKAKSEIPQVVFPVPLELLFHERAEKVSEIASLRGLLANLREPNPGDRSLKAAERKIVRRSCEEALMLARIDLDCVVREIEERSILDEEENEGF